MRYVHRYNRRACGSSHESRAENKREADLFIIPWHVIFDDICPKRATACRVRLSLCITGSSQWVDPKGECQQMKMFWGTKSPNKREGASHSLWCEYMETNGLYFSPAKGSFLNSPTISPSPLSSPVPDETLPPYPIAFRPTLLRWYLHRSTPWAARTGSSVHARPVAPDIAASTISRTRIAAHFVVFAGVTWLILLGRICLAFKLCILLRKSEFWSEIEREYRKRVGNVGDPLFILFHRTP